MNEEYNPSEYDSEADVFTKDAPEPALHPDESADEPSLIDIAPVLIADLPKPGEVNESDPGETADADEDTYGKRTALRGRSADADGELLEELPLNDDEMRSERLLQEPSQTVPPAEFDSSVPYVEPKPALLYIHPDRQVAGLYLRNGDYIQIARDSFKLVQVEHRAEGYSSWAIQFSRQGDPDRGVGTLWAHEVVGYYYK